MHPEPRHLFPVPIVALGAVLLAAWATTAFAGPAGTWQRISPPSQSQGAITHDTSRGRVYVFGGDGSSLVHMATDGGPPTQWSDLATTGTPPPALSGHKLFYDGGNDRLIVFGGRDANGHLYNTIWQLTLSGTPTWSVITPTGAVPAPRANFGACFDQARGILVVFSGLDSTGALLNNHTWQIDLAPSPPQWSEWYPDANTPSARSNAVVGDVPSIDGMVVYGGNDGSAERVDAHTMSFGSHDWSTVSATGDTPSPSANVMGTYDTDDDLLFLWGGNGGGDDVRTLSIGAATWTIRPNNNWQDGPAGHLHPLGVWIEGGQNFICLDGDGSNQLFEFFYLPGNTSYWQNWSDPGSLDDPRYASSFVYDRADDMAFLSNGFDNSAVAVQGTWSYGFGAGSQGWNNTWFWNDTENPTFAVDQHAAVWDDAHERMIVFGGYNGSWALQNEVFAMQKSGGFYEWTVLSPTGTPPTPRYGVSAIYDPVGVRMLVFGGTDASGNARGDLTQLSLDGTPAWTTLHPAGGPNGRWAPSAVYDPFRGRMLVFGGSDSLYGSLDNDVWALNLPGMTWTHLAPTGTPPPGRLQHTAVFDTRRNRMLVTGGTVASGDARDVWELNCAPATPVWTRLAPTLTALGTPIGRYLHAAVYDSTGDRMVLYGGLMPPIGIFGSPYPLKDLWALQFDFSNATAAVGPARTLAEFAVSEPAPNPSHGVTRLSFEIAQAGRVRAEIFDITGRRVATLADGPMAPGRHDLAWDGRAGGTLVHPGLYFARIEANGHSASRRLLRVE